jgi:hypothetical protein
MATPVGLRVGVGGAGGAQVVPGRHKKELLVILFQSCVLLFQLVLHEFPFPRCTSAVKKPHVFVQYN